MFRASFLLSLCLSVLSCSPVSDISGIDLDSSSSPPSRDSPTKSILRVSNSPGSRMLQNISFAPDTKRFSDSPAILRDTIKDLKGAIKYAYANIEIDWIYIDKNYDIVDGRFIIDYDLPKEFQEMIDTNLSGLETVKIGLNDLASLIVFLSYHLNISNSPDKTISQPFYEKFIETFPENHAVVNFIIKLFKKEKKRLAKSSAMDDLLSLALSNGLYYTVEAFYSAFGSYCWRHFIKESIRSNNSKLFKRFHDINPTYKPERLLIWAIEYENVPVYNEVIGSVTVVDAIIDKFKKESLILRLAFSSCYFPGLADLFAKHEKKYFDEALVKVIENGNHLLFKEMIKQKNSFFDKSFNATTINTLRLIFWDNLPSVNLNSFVYTNDFKAVYRIIIQLQSDDPKILRIFDAAVPDMVRCGFHSSALAMAVYKNNRNYLKLLLNNSGRYMVPIVYEGIIRYYGVWELVLGANNYDEIMKDIVSCNGFTILHAIANSDLPKDLWPEIIEKHRAHLRIEGDYPKFIENAGFVNDSDLSVFGLQNNKNWNLLDLAILNFNYTAVKFLLNSFEFLPEELETSKLLAQKVKTWTESSSFYRDHLYTRAFGKLNICIYGREKNPHLFHDNDANLMNPVIISKLINSDMSKIIKILNK